MTTAGRLPRKIEMQLLNLITTMKMKKTSPTSPLSSNPSLQQHHQPTKFKLYRPSSLNLPPATVQRQQPSRNDPFTPLHVSTAHPLNTMPSQHSSLVKSVHHSLPTSPKLNVPKSSEPFLKLYAHLLLMN